MPRLTMQVEIRGVVYPSTRAAAKALGVAVATVYDAVIRRDPDSVGIGRGNRPPASRKGGKPPKPVIVAGMKFKSTADLARFLGREPRNVRVSLRRGEIAHQRIVLAVMAEIARREKEARKKIDAA